MVSPGEITLSHVKAIDAFKQPSNVHEVQRFLGLESCYVQTPRILTFLFWREGIWDRKGMEGCFRCLSRRSMLWREPRVEHTCFKSQMWVSVSYDRCDTVWDSAFVGPL